MSLFFDIFMCLTKDMSASDFEAGRYSRTSSESSEDESLLVNFRKALWYQLVELNKIQLKASECLTLCTWKLSIGNSDFVIRPLLCSSS